MHDLFWLLQTADSHALGDAWGRRGRRCATGLASRAAWGVAVCPREPTATSAPAPATPPSAPTATGASALRFPRPQNPIPLINIQRHLAVICIAIRYAFVHNKVLALWTSPLYCHVTVDSPQCANVGFLPQIEFQVMMVDSNFLRNPVPIAD